MMSVLATQEVGNIDGVLVGGTATICNDVGTLEGKDWLMCE